MKYTVRKSIVQVVGAIWQPGVTCAQELVLTDHDATMPATTTAA